jgi:uncharacterized protein (TIGR02246 family)
MKRYGLTAVVAALAAGVWAAWAQPPARQPGGDEAAGVRKLAADYTEAFNAGDATAVARAWTADGEYTDPDGDTHRGWTAIEKEFAATFATNPKATVEITVETVRPLGKQVAAVEGTAKTRSPADPEPAVSRFSGVFAREDDGWRIASLTDWVPDAAADVPVADLGWLVGEWAAKGDGGDLKVMYAWDEAKAFLRGSYTITRDGKAAATGLHVIGRDPLGGLRGWVFDRSGAFGEAAWSRDGSRWLADSVGALPDGSELAATAVLVPLGPDAFTWQAVGRTAGGAELPDDPPVKVTRVKPTK